jgi:glycosyltransferase involved in cell wall biosynthesis
MKIMIDNEQKIEGGLRTRGEHKQPTPEMPLISVVTVVYNGDRYLEQTIQSVSDQTYENIEYIIVDGGSSDGTLDIIRKYEERLDYWVSEPDKGIYDAMNKGIDLSRGELIGLLNADDYYELNAIEAVVDRYRSDPTPQILYGNTFFLQEELNLRYKSYCHTKYWLGMGISHQAMFVHQDIYRSLGPYDTGLRIAADYDFFVKSIRNGVRYTPIDAFLVNYRNSGVSARNQIVSMREGRKVLRRYVTPFSREHLVNLGLLGKSMVLVMLLRVIRAVFGEKNLARASTWYLKTFIAKEWEPLR